MNKIREYRSAAAWSQQELAGRSGLSRATVSAIELDRMTPNVHAALALARAFSCRVEDLFTAEHNDNPVRWLAGVPSKPCRVWLAQVGDATIACPAEVTHVGEIAHDAWWDGSHLDVSPESQPARTLLMAGCDPAVALLARHLDSAGIRVLPLVRASGEALEMLKRGVVNVAGVHPPEKGLQRGIRRIPVLRWTTGIAVSPAARVRHVKDVFRKGLAWVMRQPGSGAQLCIEELFAEYGGVLGNRARVAPDHRALALAIQLGYANAGVCIQLAAKEAGLDFLEIRQESYEFCTLTQFDGDPRAAALKEALHSPQFRKQLAQLPGYTPAMA